jgi:S1-C subfamily serine protease
VNKTCLRIGLAVGIAVALTIGLLITSDNSDHREKTNLKNIEQSFTHILVKNNIILKGCIAPHNKPPCEKLKLNPISPPIKTMGSGAVVAHGVNTTYVITAGHVCTFETPSQTKNDGYTFFVEPRVEIKARDYWGNIHPASVVAVDNENDICILRTRGIWSTPIPMATKMPVLGEKVTTIAAPLGIFSPGMVLKFDGHYVGSDKYGHAFFTTPTAPGSSGSVILNKSGEIVSVIHSAMRRFESVGLGSRVEDVLELLRTNVLNVGSLSWENDEDGYLGKYSNIP